jgi:hypothetical protein
MPEINGHVGASVDSGALVGAEADSVLQLDVPTQCSSGCHAPLKIVGVIEKMQKCMGTLSADDAALMTKNR